MLFRILFFASLLLTYVASATSSGQTTDIFPDPTPTKPLHKQHEKSNSLKKTKKSIVYSPDETKYLYVDSQKNGNKEIWLVEKKTGATKQLTNNKVADHSPQWSPNGKKIVYCSGKSGAEQIYEMNANGENNRCLTSCKHGARNPAYSKIGWISFLRMYPRTGKVKHSDFVILRGDKMTDVLKNEYIRDYRWSPDGKRVAIGSPHKITIHDARFNSSKTIDIAEHDNRLYSHCAEKITWDDDCSRFVCKIPFLGGRAYSQGEDPADHKIFGDDEIFMVSANGKIETVAEPDKLTLRPKRAGEND